MTRCFLKVFPQASTISPDIANGCLKRSKSWDMRYYWLRDRQMQRQFDIYWEEGIKNLADYFTKHHSTLDHQAKRSKYVNDKLHYLAHPVSAILSNFSTATNPAPSEGVLLLPRSRDEQTAVWPLGRNNIPPSQAHASPDWTRAMHTHHEDQRRA